MILWSLLVVLMACRAAPRGELTVTPAYEPPSAGGAVFPTHSLSHTPTPFPSHTPTPSFSPRDVHEAEGAGQWYPAEAEVLRAAVAAYIGQAEVEPLPGRPLAVIVPHAGYLYSGAVAGYAFRALQEAGCAGHTLAVIGDTHTGRGAAEVAVWAAGAFETPLGAAPVDEQVAQALVAADERIQFDRAAFQSQHPVENQLPFVQVACPGARIVPLVLREPTMENAQALAGALVAAWRERSLLIVASTDLSHYHSYEEARQIDEVALQAIASLDPQAVIDSPRRCAELGIAGDPSIRPELDPAGQGPSTMCSQGAVLAAMIAARQMGADRATVLHYANSGDVPIGERDQVVGYGAVVLWQSEGEGSNPADMGFSLPPAELVPSALLPLSPEAQQELLALARRTAAQFLATQTFPPFQTDDPALRQPLGAYVTYEKGGALRGCLGRLVGDRPAYLNVQYAAAAAALADSRFLPVTREELDELTIEVTLLGPIRQAASADEIQVGRHGVLMRVGEKEGALFLPQVPLEQGWDRAAMLVQLCRKAGLPDDAWQRPDARFYVFEGQWFGEGGP